MPKKEAVVTEKLVKDKVKKLLTVYGKYVPIYTSCPMTFGYGESGHPDRIVMIKGVYIGVELKKDANNHHCRPELKPKPSEVMQRRQAEKIRAAGGLWLCIHNSNIAELLAVLNNIAFGSPDGSPNFSDADKKTIEALVGD